MKEGQKITKWCQTYKQPEVEERMGGITRMTRCERFRNNLEDMIMAKTPLQKGDTLEVLGVCVGQSEDGTEVSKVYITVRNTGTRDEYVLTFDECVYDPEGEDESNVRRLYDHLYDDREDGKEFRKHRTKVINLLKKAELIYPAYKEKP